MIARAYVMACVVLLMSGAIDMAAQTAERAAAPPAPDVQARFPAGPGRDAFFKVSNTSHRDETVLGQLKTRDEWSETLDEIASNGAHGADKDGAHGSDEEWAQILAYLDKHYSLIFINKATAKELESTLDVAPAVAEAIVARRSERGAFKSIDDLKQVAGVAAAAIDARKDRLIF